MGAARRRGRAAAEKLVGLASVAGMFDDFPHARDVMRRVRAVPSRFVQFDHATRVGGLPTERLTVVHGPSNHGKTLFALGHAESFLALDNPVLYVDAERTTPFPWVLGLMGERANSPLFKARRPETYEGTIADVRNFLNTVAAARKKVGDETSSALVIVDSLKKLVPADLMKEILEAEAEGKDIKSGRDRRAQLQAKMNSAWMDELVPLLEHAGAAFIAIAREMQDPDADMWAKKFGNDYKVGGGGAIIFDSSLLIRVERAGWVQHGEGKDRKVYGERHRITIRKTKVAGKDAKQVVSHFHSSNGVLIPEGFDRARDVLELAVRFDVVERRGSGYSYGGDRLGSSEHNAVQLLAAAPDVLAAMEAEVRAKFATVAPVEHDEDGVIS